jgi:hypothetical protein
VADQPKCLCIVARDRLRGSDFIAALGASLRPDDQLEIIVDRRSGEPSADWDRAEDRRQRPQVDIALRANGFALVPAPSPRGERAATATAERIAKAERIATAERIAMAGRTAKGERTPLSLLLPSAPSSRLEPEDDYEDDDDRERLDAIRSFKRGRSRGLAPWLVAALAVVAAAAFVLSPVGQTLKQSLAQRASPQAPAPPGPPPARTPDGSTAPREPAVAEKPVADKPIVEKSMTEKSVAEKAAGEKPGAEAPVRAPARQEPSPLSSRDGETATSLRGTRTPPVESSVPPRDAPGSAVRERARTAEVARPSVSEPAARRAVGAVPPPAEPGSRLSSPRFAGLPRVELSREAGTASGTYAVRIIDPAGRPLGDAEVLLLARMPDGTVENVRMDFYPDHGTYRGALPPTRSSPVDLRVRVITGDKRVEIPLGP